jgi:glutathione-regulated potassium-efflux system ancillary protein KefC
MFLTTHIKVTEMSKALMGFKDIFLVEFLLSIGFTALPTSDTLGLVTLLIRLTPIKILIFYCIFSML